MLMCDSRFSTPSSINPNSTVWLSCERYFDDWQLVETAWEVAVLAVDGEPIDNGATGQLATDYEGMIRILAEYYDGLSTWTCARTGEKHTFWQLMVGTMPENAIADLFRLIAVRATGHSHPGASPS